MRVNDVSFSNSLYRGQSLYKIILVYHNDVHNQNFAWYLSYQLRGELQLLLECILDRLRNVHDEDYVDLNKYYIN